MPTPSRRVIRVFVSSTFRDMQAEREELTKIVFPQLRKLCESRDVVLGEVDLRWGVTEEQKAEGKVLPICLAEIGRCRPYFIGLLGERYGWVPEEIGDEIVEREPWLRQHRSRSVTELEFLHGVLNQPNPPEHAYFYFRDAAYVDSLPPDRQDAFREGPTPEEVGLHGREEAARRAEERRTKLAALKERIRASGLPVRENYANPRVLGELVLDDFTRLIERLYPEGLRPSPLALEVSQHDAFADDLARVYIGRADSFAELDAHVAGSGPPMVVLGEPGAGKSALLANWLRHLRQPPARASLWERIVALVRRSTREPPIVLAHFIGATSRSTDWAAMTRRLIGELQERAGIHETIPDAPDDLRVAFANTLHMAASKRRVVLIIDALDQLEDRDSARELPWLPEELPQNVRLVVATLPGSSLDELTRREWPVLRVPALDPTQRLEVIREYLAIHSKALSPDRASLIAAAPQAGNALYLRVLLEELRLHGAHETLDAKIAQYLAASSVEGLFGLVLARYEEDFERDRPGLVRDAMTCLWAARRGLSDAELFELLGSGGERLANAIWSPLHLAAEQWLVDRSGLHTFFHGQLRLAVCSRYLPTEADQRAAHRRLSDFFGARTISARVIEELPWQLANAHLWDQLYELLCRFDFAVAAWDQDEIELKSFWAAVERQLGKGPAEAYAVIAEMPEVVQRSMGAGLSKLVRLLFDMGHPRQAKALGNLVEAQMRESALPTDLAGRLARETLAMMRSKAGTEPADTPAHVKELQQEAGAAGLRMGDLQGALVKAMVAEGPWIEALGDKAANLKRLGDLDGAFASYKEQEAAIRKTGEEGWLGENLNNQANVLMHRNLDQAKAALDAAERIARSCANKRLLGAVAGNKALIQIQLKDWDGASAHLQEQQQLYRQLGHRGGLLICLSNLALVVEGKGEFDRALSMHREVEQKARSWGSKPQLLNSLGNQAALLVKRGENEGAMDLFKQVEDMARETGDAVALMLTLGNRGSILSERGDLDEALAVVQECERLSRETGAPLGRVQALRQLSDVHRRRGEHDKALSFARESEAVARAAQDLDGLVRALCFQAFIGDDLGEIEEPMRCAEEAVRIASVRPLAELAADAQAILGLLGRKRLVAQARESVVALPTPGSHEDLAIALLQAGEIDEAIKQLNEALKLNPMYVGAHYGLGIAYERKGEKATALGWYRMAHAFSFVPNPMALDAVTRLAAELGEAPFPEETANR